VPGTRTTRRRQSLAESPRRNAASPHRRDWPNQAFCRGGSAGKGIRWCFGCNSRGYLIILAVSNPWRANTWSYHSSSVTANHLLPRTISSARSTPSPFSLHLAPHLAACFSTTLQHPYLPPETPLATNTGRHNMSAEPDHTKPKVDLSKYALATRSLTFAQLLTIRRDPSGAEKKDVTAARRLAKAALANPPQNDETATAILKKKKKPNSLM
jgi:hypothetical protein